MQRLLKASFGLLVFSTLVLFPSPALADGKLRGNVTMAGGEPVADFPVQLIPSDPGLVTLNTKSDKRGRFVFGIIRQGDYRLIAVQEGVRISRIDVNIATREDESVWAYHGELPPGAELPEFTVTGLASVTYDIQLKPHSGDPGKFGTGLPISTVDVVIGMIEEGDTAGAITEIEKNLAAKPDSATFNYLLAYVLLGQGETDKGLGAVDKALTVDPAFEGASLLKARLLETKGDIEAATEWYRREVESAAAVEVQRDAYLGLAVAYEKLERADDAISALESLIVIVPDHVDAHRELASLYLQTGEQDKAREMMDRVNELGGEDPNILYNLGAERFNAGEFEEAADYFSRAVQADPDFADAHLQLGYTRLNLGDLEGAADSLRRYVELHPEGEHAETARQLLGGITQE